MVSKNQIKFIRGLKEKKNRVLSKKIVVEGLKTIQEFMDSKYDLDQLYSTSSELIKNFQPELINDSQLKLMSNQRTPSGTIGIFNMIDKSVNIKPGLAKDSVQMDKRNEADTYITGWWIPKTGIDVGIAKVFNAMKKNYE